MVAIPQIITEDRASGAQFISGSLKFDSGKSTHLQRTQVGGNRKTFTWSAWIKKGQYNAGGSDSHDWFSASEGSTTAGVDYGFGVRFPYYTGHNTHSDQLMVFEFENSAFKMRLISEQVFRDHGGFYHIVIAVDTTIASPSSDRVKVYINGERITAWKSGYETYPSQNLELTVNESGKTSQIGCSVENGSGIVQLADGYASNFYLIDGQQLGPEEFGFTDPLTNTWRPKKYTGAFTRSSVNNGTNWTQSLSATSGTLSNGANAFDGDLSTRAQTANAAAGKELTFAPPAINFTTSLEVYCDQGSAVPTATWNGNTVNPGGGAWVTVYSGSGELSSTYPLVINTETAAQYATLKGVRIDGEILIDNLNGSGANSFYLPMDGISPIGKDQSGNGNDFTPVAFGGSVELPKATGAIPILNTNEAGTIAKKGVRTDSKTYTVTASGGNYYLDGALKPTLNAYRGGSYTFDYTGATSHPFYLSSLQDGKWNSKAYSVEFDGSTSSKYLSIDDTADLRLGTGDWTIEEFVYIPAGTTMSAYWVNSLSVGGESNTEAGASIYHTLLDSTTGTNGGVSFIGPSNSYRLYYKVDTRGRWAHIAVTRESGTVRLFVDGTLADSTTDNADYNATTGSKIGVGSLSQNNYLNGKVSNVRVVKGQALYTSSFTPPSTTLTTTSQGAIASNVKLLCCQDSDPTTATVIPSGSTISNTNSVAAVNDCPFLYDSNGEDGVNTGTLHTTKITIPHTAADTLYYYCSVHSGMGSSINVTTDIFKADPYAWKCMFAMASDTIDHSPEINVNSTASIFGDIHTTTLQRLRNFYGHSKKMETGGGFRIDMELTTAAANAKHKWETGDFTVECWHYQNGATTSWQSLMRSASYNNSTLGSVGIAHYANGQTLFPYWGGNSDAGNFGQTSTCVPYKKWNHTAWTRQAGVNRIFANGVIVKTFTDSRSYDNRGFEIGDVYTWTGGYQDARIYNGVAKYTENFVVPATEPDVLPDTPSGIIGKTNLTKITDGAVYFDGTNDNLTITAHSDLDLSSGDFTVEGFVYPQRSQEQSFVTNWNSGGQFQVQMSSSGTLQASWAPYSTSEYAVTGTTPIRVNSWSHFAYTRSGNTFELFLNGISQGTRTSSANGSTNNNIVLGENGGNADRDLLGFLSNVRIIKGTALYTSDFTPPTRELTNVTNTKLLCCQSTTSASASTVQPSHDITVTSSGSGSVGNLSAITSTGSNYYLDYRTVGRAWVQLNFASTQSSVTSIKLSGGGYLAGSNYDLYVNGVLVQDDRATVTGWAEDTITISSTNIDSIRIDGSDGYAIGALKFNDTLVSGTIGGAIARGNAAATNFNPFTDDINTIRGQESGYATWNPLFNNTEAEGVNGAISDGNLYVAQAVHGVALGNFLMTSGKWYFEALIENGNMMIGVMGEDYTPNTQSYNWNKAYGIYPSGTRYVIAGSMPTSPVPNTTNVANVAALYGVAVDIDNRKMWIHKDGRWTNNNQFLSTTSDITLDANSPGFYAWFHSAAADGNNCTANFGQKPFKFPPPDGFQPLNLSNVQPEKVIARPDQYVDIATWTGDGTNGSGTSNDRQVTGLGHKPDLVWCKIRTQAYTHVLWDSVRGAGVNKELQPNEPNQEGSANTAVSGYISEFTSDGFKTVTGTTDNDYFDRLNDTYVAWCWKAGGNKNTYNIDDVGYANASDVNMNAGALNSSVYNQSQNWTALGTGDGAGSPYDWEHTFDGDSSTYGAIAPQNSALNLDLSGLPGGGLSYSQSVVITYNRNSSAPDVTVNGSAISATADGTDRTHTITGSGILTSVGGETRTAAGAGDMGIKKIVVDGKELVDSGVTPPNVPSIAPTKCSVGTKQGFSIITYGNISSSYDTVAHGLTQAPEFGIFKCTTEDNSNWGVYYTVNGNNANWMALNNTNAQGSGVDFVKFYDKHIRIYPTSFAGQGAAGVGYMWHSIPGLQKFGSYTGNNSANGVFIELGFKPAIVWIKCSGSDQSGNAHWIVFDTTRSEFNPSSNVFLMNENHDEYTSADGIVGIDLLSNGFKLRDNNNSRNAETTYIYCAWAEAPSFNLYGAQANAR